MAWRDRMRSWQQYFGLRETNSAGGPSNEDMARERSHLQSLGIEVGPDEDPFEVAARRFDETSPDEQCET
ncbi:MAG: hypothetical protein ACKVHU_10375 [Acidimicrobiales bacterium]|jgi:hypothetical protein